MLGYIGMVLQSLKLTWRAKTNKPIKTVKNARRNLKDF